MDAQQALADLTEISSQVRAAVVFDDKGKVAASTVPDGEAFAQAAADLLVAAEQVRAGESPLTQLEVATSEGAVFVVREGKATIAATTGADPTVGLVFYDLKSALRSVKPKPAPRRKPAETKTTTAKSTTAKSTTPKKKPAATRTKKKTDGS
jgi:predicted regulator of Ras-like GTPase activity (Roadblock/LC7/MglB family)